MVEAIVEFDYAAQEPDELTIRKGDIITGIKQMPGGWWEGVLRGKKGVFPDNFVKVFPANNVKEDKNSASVVKLRNVGSTTRRCRVLYSYKPSNEDELELHEDQVIEILGEVEEGWWRGKLNNKQTGVFPSNFVKEEIDAVEAVKSVLAKVTPGDKPAQEDTKPDKQQQQQQSKDTLIVTITGAAPKKERAVETSGAKPTDNEGPTLPPKPSREYCKVLFKYEAVNEDELSLNLGDVVSILSRHTQEVGWWKGELGGKVGVFPDNFVEVISADEGAKKFAASTNTTKAPAVTNSSSINASGSVVPAAVENSSAKPKEDTQHTKNEKRLTGLGKKPAAPPPSKKPPPPATVSLLTKSFPPPAKPNASSGAGDVSDGGRRPAAAPQVCHRTSPQASEFDIVERGAMLTHPTVTRVKAPRRRPPSTVYVKEPAENGLVNGESPGGAEETEKPLPSAQPAVITPAAAAGAAAAVSPPLKEFERQAQKLTWVEELRQNQSRNRKSQSPAAAEPVVPAVVSPAEKKPSELILSAAAEVPDGPPLRPTASHTPAAMNRTSQPDSISSSTSLQPAPLSSPRHISPLAEAGPQPVAFKRPIDTSQQQQAKLENKPVAVTRPPSVVSSGATREALDKVAELELRLQELSTQFNEKMERLERRLTDEQNKTKKLEGEVERLKTLISSKN